MHLSEITHRFQTARAEVRVSLLQCLLPWLENMELVAASVPPATPLSYIMVSRQYQMYFSHEEGYFMQRHLNISESLLDAL